MRAAVVRAFNELTIEDIDVPEPGPGEVLVRLVATGVCHTDLTLLRGNIPVPVPFVLGHEGAGIVEKVGVGVDDLVVGDHVVLSIVVSCGSCDRCQVGDQAICSQGLQVVLGGTMPDGTTRLSSGDDALHHVFCQSSFAEYAVVPARAAVAVRKDAPLEKIAILGCGATTGIGAVTRRAKVPAGSSVVVIGAGGVGLATIMAAKAVGAYPIIAVDVNDGKLEIAKTLGATHTVRAGDDAVANVAEVVGIGVDFAFDAVGADGTLATAFQMLRPGGLAVAIGLAHATTLVTVDVFSLLLQKRLTGTYAGSIVPKVDIPAIVDLYMDGRLPLDQLITAEYKLDDVSTAFKDMEAGRIARGVVVY